MKANTAPLDQRLLAVEQIAPNSRQQLEQELSHMFQRELSQTRRAFFGAVAAGALVSGGVCGALALSESDLPTLPESRSPSARSSAWPGPWSPDAFAGAARSTSNATPARSPRWSGPSPC